MGVQHHTEATKAKIRAKLKGRPLSAATRQKMKGRRPWNKGLRGVQVAWNKGSRGVMVAWNKGLRGAEPWNKGKPNPIARGARNGHWKGGKAHCIDCQKQLTYWRDGSRCLDCFRAFNRGENHYKWTGGPDSELLRIRTSTEYNAWRREVFSRDLFTCQMPGCRYRGREIQANHIKPVRVAPELILETDNGITLCKQCHAHIRMQEAKYERLFTTIVELTKGLVVAFSIRLT